MSNSTTIERPEVAAATLSIPADPQRLYNEILELKSTLASDTKTRHDMLAQNTQYVQLSETIGTVRLQRKQIELTFDQENGRMKERMQMKKDLIASKELSLRDLALEHWRLAGTSLELIKTLRSGKVKKIRIQFVPRFQQLSLFAAPSVFDTL